MLALLTETQRGTGCWKNQSKDIWRKTIQYDLKRSKQHSAHSRLTGIFVGQSVMEQNQIPSYSVPLWILGANAALVNKRQANKTRDKRRCRALVERRYQHLDKYQSLHGVDGLKVEKTTRGDGRTQHSWQFPRSRSQRCADKSCGRECKWRRH